MKSFAVTFGLVVAATLVIGCGDKKPAASSSVTDLRSTSSTSTPPAPPVVVQPVQPAQPVQPVIADSAPVVTPAIASSSTPTISGNSYTIQKGDTLYKIARAKYGNPTAVKKIVEANPGMDPNHIKVGQKINLPS